MLLPRKQCGRFVRGEKLQVYDLVRLFHLSVAFDSTVVVVGWLVSWLVLSFFFLSFLSFFSSSFHLSLVFFLSFFDFVILVCLLFWLASGLRLVSEDLKCWRAWDTTCGHKTKNITHRSRNKEELFDNLPWKEREGPSSSQAHIGTVPNCSSEEMSERCWWSAYRRSQALKYHLELNWAELLDLFYIKWSP